jgi:uncharacterized membrane protein
MIRWLGWLLAGVLLGGIVHIVTVLALPTMATRDAYARLAAATATNQVTLLAQPAPDGAMLPFMDPAFATAVCRYDLAAAPLTLQMPVAPSYTSATFYTPQGIAFYAINDRAAGRRALELHLVTAPQRSRLQIGDDATPADRLIVESPTTTGLIVLRALAPEPGAMPTARGIVGGARCTPRP